MFIAKLTNHELRMEFKTLMFHLFGLCNKRLETLATKFVQAELIVR
jgi:hypothetical protein